MLYKYLDLAFRVCGCVSRQSHHSSSCLIQSEGMTKHSKLNQTGWIKKGLAAAISIFIRCTVKCNALIDASIHKFAVQWICIDELSYAHYIFVTQRIYVDRLATASPSLLDSSCLIQSEGMITNVDHLINVIWSFWPFHQHFLHAWI